MLEFRGEDWHVVNLGLGARSVAGDSQYTSEVFWTKYIFTQQPDVAVFFMGTNDSWMRGGFNEAKFS